MFSAGRVLLMPKGAYNPLTTYEMLDIVSYNGSSYIAKGTTTGNLPTDTTYWQLSAYGGQAANIAGNFAELESSSVATAIHYVDDIFVDENSQLMKATQTINIGDTIDANVNCAPTTVEALIAYLSSYVDSLDSLNKKIQGAIEIAAQTDLHSLAIGEYYKKQTTFYITNGPTGIDQDPTAIFRLTVEAALDNASQASSPLLLTLRTPDGKIYTQSFDGTNWGSWVEVASAASVSALNTAKQPKTLDTPITVGGVQQTTVEGALGSINQTLTNKVANEIATRAKVSGHNFVPYPYHTNSATINGITWIVNSDGSVTANGTATGLSIFDAINTALYESFSLDEGDYILTDNLTAGDYSNAYTAITLQYSDGTVEYNHADTSIGKNEFSMPAKSQIKNFYLGLVINDGATVSNLVFKPMIKFATDESADYEPYSMTNQQMTPYVQAISNPNLLDNPWFTVNQRGQSSYSGTADYSYDRWYRQQSGITVSLDSDECIVIQNTDSNYSNFKQPFSAELIKAINGRTLTLSVLFKDGTIVSATSQNIDLSQNASYCSIRLADGTNANIRSTNISNVSLQIAVKGNITIPAIRAFKLELGSVSTLAQDTAPNYQQELAKCQRYFVRYASSSNNATLALGTEYGSLLYAPLYLPVVMRTFPTITFSGSIKTFYTADGTKNSDVTSLSVAKMIYNCIKLAARYTTSLGNGAVAEIQVNDGAYVDISADL